jgi:HSP20 family protein
MILLRRGRLTPSFGSSNEVDVMVDFGQAPARNRNHCRAPWRPPIDVFETSTGLVVRAELGGLTTSEVQLLLSQHELIIQSERDVAHHNGHRVYHESHVRYGQFEAAVRLPFAVNIDSATAEYVDGILSIELPRLAATKLTTHEERGADSAPRGD